MSPKSKIKPFKKDKASADLSHKKSGYELKGRIWIEGNGGTFLGYGRIVLLERIRDYGSISAAAKSMNMSYRHAWELVDSMNHQSKKPLVEANTGGRGGGGTRLTESGKKAVEGFWRLFKGFNDFLQREVSEMDF